MYPIKQSTAITGVFFAHDANGDGVTGLVDGGFTKRISKNGGAFAAMTVTITEMENGFYSYPLSTSHSDTNGILTLSFSHASTKRINQQFRVSTNIYDDISNAVWDTDATTHQTQGTFGQAIGDPVADTNTLFKAVVTDATGATVGVDVVAIKAETVTILADTNDIQTRLPAALVSGRMDSSIGEVAANAITAAGLDPDVGTEIAGAVWNEDATGHQTLGTFGQAIGDPVADTNTIFKAVVTDATGATVGVDVVAIKAETVTILADTNDIQTRIPAALVSGRIDASVGAIAADAITAASMAADASAEIADAVWDEDATGHQTQGTFGQAIGDPVADTNTIFKAVVTDATGATVGVDVVAVQADTDNIQTRLPAALVSGRMDSSIGAVAADAITAAGLAADVTTELQAGLATSANLAIVAGYIDTEIATLITTTDAILVDTAEIGVAGAGLTNINLPNQTMDIVGNITGNLSGSVGSVTGLVVANLDATVSSRATPAQVNTEVLDVFTVDTFAQPGQSTPVSTTTLQLMLGWLYKAWRNRTTQTATEYKLYNDDATTVDQKATFSDDGTTADRSEQITGP